MSNIARMMQQATAGAAGAGLDVDEVFSTFLYTGTGSSQTITNGIDLSGEGGLVWIKRRVASSYNHNLFDTERGATKWLVSDDTDAEGTRSTGLTSFNSNGFTQGGSGWTGENAKTYVSWTFRKAPKFFDVVTYSGSSSAQTIAHNLGVTPAMIIVKQLNSSGRWTVYHKDASPTGNPENGRVALNTTDQWYEYPGISSFANLWNQTAPTSTHFTVGTDATTGASGSTYVAYLFAHNNNDGEFGPDSDQDIIKCDKYTGGTTGTEVNVGFEPQFVMIKRTTGSGDWMVFDAMRGVVSDPYPNLDNTLFWNLNNAERTNTGYIGFTPTGFIHQGGSGDTNTNGDTYIYMAIRRGPLAAPTDATKVFTPVLGDGSGTPSIKTTNHITDFGIAQNKTGGGTVVGTRLLGPRQLKTHTDGAESANSYFGFDFQNGWHTWTGLNTDYINWNWKRAPSYFDMVIYTGTGSNRTVSHNLGAVPEMMWIKNREASESWIVYHKALGATKYAMLDKDDADITNSTRFNNTTPTASVFTVGTDNSTNSPNSNTHVAYLFATVAGVSKVGSYTGNGSDGHIIDCGFSNGARFILIRLVGTSGSWYIFDTARGIVSGSDPYLKLDTTDAEASSDLIDPHSSGFIVNNSALINANGYTHIFYAIA